MRRAIGGVALCSVAVIVLGAVIAARSGAPVRGKEAVPSPKRRPAPSPERQGTLQFQDDFSLMAVDPDQWSTTSLGDFEEKAIDSLDGRLRIRCATRGTREETVKFLGVGSVRDFKLTEGTVISFDLDWNRQENGCYLSAGIVLAPTLTAENPLDADESLKLEYVGVPPGKNGRLLIETRKGGRLHQLFTEGWPQRQRFGRALAVQRVEIRIGSGGAFSVSENGELIFESAEGALGFSSGRLYLQLSSHSNYGPREVYFDNVRVVAPAVTH